MIENLVLNIINGLMMGAIYALIVLGLSIVFGVMNVVNFAHGDFVMLSMYGTFLIANWLSWDAIATPLITFPVLFIFGVIIYYILIQPTLREKYVIQIAVTVGLTYFFRAFTQIVFKASPRALNYSIIQGNIQIGEMTILTSRIISAAISLIVIFLVYVYLNKTWSGKAIRAASDDLDVASLVGVNYQRTYALAFGLGTALTAIAGGLLMTFQQVGPLMGLSYGLLGWVILAMAGLGSTVGVLVSGLIVGVAESLSMAYWDPRSRLLVVYLLFILVLWIKPRGLFGRK